MSRGTYRTYRQGARNPPSSREETTNEIVDSITVPEPFQPLSMLQPIPSWRAWQVLASWRLSGTGSRNSKLETQDFIWTLNQSANSAFHYPTLLKVFSGRMTS